jgi:hypothetical protein
MQHAAYAAGHMPTDLSNPDTGQQSQALRLGIADAAVRLGVSPDTIRRRIKRGKLQGNRDNTGKLWIVLPAGFAQARAPLPEQPAAYVPMQQDQSAVIDELRNHVVSLRSELDRAHAEQDRLLNMLMEAQAALVRRNQGMLAMLWDRLFGPAGLPK